MSDIDRKGTVRIALWDRPSTITMQATDVYPEDPDARKLGWFRGTCFFNASSIGGSSSISDLWCSMVR